jgi:hypothetical protein
MQGTAGCLYFVTTCIGCGIQCRNLVNNNFISVRNQHQNSSNTQKLQITHFLNIGLYYVCTPEKNMAYIWVEGAWLNCDMYVFCHSVQRTHIHAVRSTEMTLINYGC